MSGPVFIGKGRINTHGSWRNSNPYFHAGWYGRQCKSSYRRSIDSKHKRPDNSWKYLSSLPASRDRSAGESSWSAPIYELGETDPHRQRRIPGFFTRRYPKDYRRWG